MNLANATRHARQRVVTKTEASALGYQSQGSYPSGLKNVRSYSLRSTLKFTRLQTETSIQLFAKDASEQKVFDTNILQGNTVPNGQALLVHEIVFHLSTPLTGTAGDGTPVFDQDAINAFANLMRNSVYTFGRENSQWDAQFSGIELMPTVFGCVNAPVGAAQAAAVRIGDFVKPQASFRLKVPVVLGQNTSFNFEAMFRSVLAAANPLVAANLDMVVELKGLLTKMAAV